MKGAFYMDKIQFYKTERPEEIRKVKIFQFYIDRWDFQTEIHLAFGGFLRVWVISK